MRERLVSERMKHALLAGCRDAGIDGEGAELMRVHSNTVFHLPAADAVARIGSGPDAMEQVAVSLEVTSWLDAIGFATVRPLVRRAFTYDGLTVSFWVFEDAADAVQPSATLASLLRRLHGVRDMPIQVPEMQSPLRGVARAVRDTPEAFDGDDRSWLEREVRACESRWQSLTFALPTGLIHGDAHPNNLLHTLRGALLCDWDHVALGPREWDLVQAAYFHRRFPKPSDDLDGAARVYGWDLRLWEGFDELIAVREISGLGAYVRTASSKPSARDELAHRIRTLRDGDIQARWHSPTAS